MTAAVQEVASADVVLARTVLASALGALAGEPCPEALPTALEAARSALYDVEGAPDAGAGLAALERAVEALGVARRLVAGLREPPPCVEDPLLPRLEQLVLAAHDAHVERAVARDRTRAAGLTRARPTFRVSSGSPALFHLERAVIPAAFATAVLPPLDAAIDELPTGDEDPTDQEEDDDEATVFEGQRRRRLRLASASGAGPARAELAHEAHYDLEEIGIASSLRRPTARHGWSVAELPEERLLRHLDALMALGVGPVRIDVVQSCLDYERQLFALDPGRLFARTIVVGSLAGSDAADVVVASLGATHLTTRRAIVDGLSLASNPSIGRAARAALLAEPDARVAAALLEVLRRRGEADLVTVSPFCAHPHPEVRAEAARALGRSSTGGPIPTRLLLDLLLRHDDAPTRLATAEALAIRGAREGLTAAREALDRGDGEGGGPLASWALLVAIAGDLSDFERLSAAGARSADALPALGWLGHPEGVPLLIDALARAHAVPAEPGEGRRPLESALAAALERLTGAGLVDPLEGEDRVGDATEAPTLDAARWRANSSEREASPPRVKLRFGQPYVPRLSLEELEAPLSFSVDRRRAALELAVAGGPAAWVDTETWYARQQLALVSVASTLGARLDAEPGVAPSRRSRG